MSRNRLINLASEALPERIPWYPPSEVRLSRAIARTNFGIQGY
jgi:hypothetical protein